MIPRAEKRRTSNLNEGDYMYAMVVIKIAPEANK